MKDWIWNDEQNLNRQLQWTEENLKKNYKIKLKLEKFQNYY